MLLLADSTVDARRALASTALAPLVASLASDLATVIDRAPSVADEKAQLTRIGGRCARDGTALDFDPFSPHAHRCPACATIYTESVHHRAWLMWYQLWLAERAVHAATLHLVAGGSARADARWPAFAARILAEAADVYPGLPNADNVLGPTRPFFSTYLESIWLTQLCVALDLLEAGAPEVAASVGGVVRDRLVAPSATLIADYPEGGSNRQVYNAVARAAAAALLGDGRALDDALHGRDGIAPLIHSALLDDGTWYEGENYHQFAHRGLWYAATMAESLGRPFDRTLVARFDRGFAAPWRVALPDDTLPARRDSQYGTTLRQWRWAEWCELGLARFPDEAPDSATLSGALTRLYDPMSPSGRRDTGRWRSAAESERNEAPSALTRADLGWKSLLHARAEAPTVGRSDDAPTERSSVHLAAQGYDVLRCGPVYVALDYGASGGGHGHPDRLNLTIADGATRWLDDPGTGSYVDASLHWYRSTLAHDAPLVDGASQWRVAGMSRGFDARSDHSATAGEAEIAPGVRAWRGVMLGDGYVVDVVRWHADHEVTVDLPVHVDGLVDDAVDPNVWRPFAPRGAGALEDGFDWLRDAEALDRSCLTARMTAVAPEPSARLYVVDAPRPNARLSIASATPVTLWRAVAPGPPGAGARRLHVLRTTGAAGAIATVWSLRAEWGEGESAFDANGDVRVSITSAAGIRDEHRVARADARAWTVTRWPGDDTAPRAVTLDVAGGPALPDARRGEPGVRGGAAAGAGSALSLPIRVALGEPDYRRSEPTWRAAGAPTATVAVSRRDDVLCLTLDVRLGRTPCFAEAYAENPYDNERADADSDGVELFVRSADDSTGDAGWLVVPDAHGGARVTATTPTAQRLPPDASPFVTSRAGADGWQATLELPLAPLGLAPGDHAAIDVLVNERPRERARRRGQLVLGGARGGRVYLQGDRHDPARSVVVQL